MYEGVPEEVELRVQRFLALKVPANPLEEKDLDRFEDLPDRRKSLRAVDSSGLSVFAGHSIAKKLYRCPCCTEDIEIGSEHVIFSRVNSKKSESHHHMDRKCFSSLVLPRLVAITTIPSHETSGSVLNKKMRRIRYKHRKSRN